MTWASAIANRRSAVGMSVPDLAAQSKVAKSQIAAFERGQCEPDSKVAKKLAKALGTTKAILTVQALDPEDGMSGPDQAEIVRRLALR